MVFQVLNERAESTVLGNDVKIGARIGCGQLSDVVSDVEVERIAANPGDLHELGAVTKPVNPVSDFERQLLLSGPDNHPAL